MKERENDCKIERNEKIKDRKKRIKRTNINEMKEERT